MIDKIARRLTVIRKFSVLSSVFLVFSISTSFLAARFQPQILILFLVINLLVSLIVFLTLLSISVMEAE
jgi:hypothetical protein